MGKPLNRIITREFVTFLKGHYRLDWDGIHGLRHWARVRANGLALARTTGADRVVVELFAFLHDSCRLNNGDDPRHGERAAQLARRLNGRHFQLDPAGLELLCFACAGHTLIGYHDDPTVGTCWDADRLDLVRIGILPAPLRLCTAAGRAKCLEIADRYADDPDMG